MIYPWRVVFTAGCISAATGFLVSPHGVPRSGSSVRPSRRAALSAAEAPPAASVDTGRAPELSVHVLSPREATVALPPTRDAYTLQWFQEDSPFIFDQTATSLQTRVTLTGLSPGSRYILRVRETGTAAVATVQPPTDVRFFTPEAEGNASGELVELSRLEIRVGRCLEARKHPDADSLYVEKVDFGEAEPRTIVSGLVAYVSEEEMRGRLVVGLCNLPPRAMRGVNSAGMLLCASNDDHTVVHPLSPSEGAKVGELITFKGVISTPSRPGGAAARAWTAVMEGMKTGADGIAGWEGIPMDVGGGVCSSVIKTGRVR